MPIGNPTAPSNAPASVEPNPVYPANLTVSVGTNHTMTVGGENSRVVRRKECATVHGNKTLSVGGDLDVTVGTNLALTVGGRKLAVTANREMTLEASDSITLRCGQASLTLKKDGTILLRGKDITLDGSGKINAKASGKTVLNGSKIGDN